MGAAAGVAVGLEEDVGEADKVEVLEGVRVGLEVRLAEGVTEDVGVRDGVEVGVSPVVTALATATAGTGTLSSPATSPSRLEATLPVSASIWALVMPGTARARV